MSLPVYSVATLLAKTTVLDSRTESVKRADKAYDDKFIHAILDPRLA